MMFFESKGFPLMPLFEDCILYDHCRGLPVVLQLVRYRKLVVCLILAIPCLIKINWYGVAAEEIKLLTVNWGFECFP